jgi:hypothetical protein
MPTSKPKTTTKPKASTTLTPEKLMQKAAGMMLAAQNASLRAKKK